MKPNSFQAFFDKFRADFAAVHGEHPAIAIDGKEMRRSLDKAAERSNMNIVTAFSPMMHAWPLELLKVPKAAARF